MIEKLKLVSQKVFLLLAAAMFGFYFLDYWELLRDDLRRHMPMRRMNKSPNQRDALILLYTSVYSSSGIEAWGENPGPGRKDTLMATLRTCPNKCRVSMNKSLLSIADAVMYHGSDSSPVPKPVNRRWNQVWVFILMESPCSNLEGYEQRSKNNDFNWTMTYRRDSDIQLLYGDFEKLPSEKEVNPVYTWTNRSLVAGMISDCKYGWRSGRLPYIAELKRFIKVDIYGGCGNYSSPSSRNDYELGYQILAKKYKFWLSFENSFSPEYVTEKFFFPLKYGMVPVYLGHPDNLRYAPPKSYINTRDFKTPESLAKHLTYLDKNPSEYLKYFEWKNDYRLKANVTSTVAWCSLCAKLHSLTNNSTKRKSYRSIPDWFIRNNTFKALCLNPWSNATGFSV